MDNLFLSPHRGLTFLTLPVLARPSEPSGQGAPVVSSTPISKSVAIYCTVAGLATSGPLSDGSFISTSKIPRPLVGGFGKSLQCP